MRELKKKVDERKAKIEKINQRKMDKEAEVDGLRAQEAALREQGTDDVDSIISIRQRIADIEKNELEVINDTLADMLNTSSKPVFTRDEFDERWAKRATELNKQLEKPIAAISVAYKKLQSAILEFNRQKSIIHEEVVEWQQLLIDAGFTVNMDRSNTDGLGLPFSHDFTPCDIITNANIFEGNKLYRGILYTNETAQERTKFKCLPNCYGMEPRYINPDTEAGHQALTL